MARGRKEKLIDHRTGDDVVAFAQELREQRYLAGAPPYREMARVARYSAPALSTAANGKKLPTWDLAKGYLRACGVTDFRKWETNWKVAQLSVRLAKARGSGEGRLYAKASPVAPAPVKEQVGSDARTVNLLKMLDELRVHKGFSLRKLALNSREVQRREQEKGRSCGALSATTIHEVLTGHRPIDERFLELFLLATGVYGEDQERFEEAFGTLFAREEEPAPGAVEVPSLPCQGGTSTISTPADAGSSDAGQSSADDWTWFSAGTSAKTKSLPNWEEGLPPPWIPKPTIPKPLTPRRPRANARPEQPRPSAPGLASRSLPTLPAIPTAAALPTRSLITKPKPPGKTPSMIRSGVRRHCSKDRYYTPQAKPVPPAPSRRTPQVTALRALDDARVSPRARRQNRYAYVGRHRPTCTVKRHGPASRPRTTEPRLVLMRASFITACIAFVALFVAVFVELDGVTPKAAWHAAPHIPAPSAPPVTTVSDTVGIRCGPGEHEAGSGAEADHAVSCSAEHGLQHVWRLVLQRA